jgi:two-component system sensor histidine kinase UhpB
MGHGQVDEMVARRTGGRVKPPPGVPESHSSSAAADAGKSEGATIDPFGLSCGPIIQAAREAIVTIDDQHRIVMINPAAQRMFGCTSAEVLGSDLSRFIPRRFHSQHEMHVRGFDASGESERSMSQRRNVVGLRANGEEFPAEATISRLDVIGELGPRSYFTALLRDISVEQSLSAENEALRRRMRGIFDLAPIAIWITDGERIVFANRACAGLFGAGDRETLVGRSIYSLFTPQSQDLMRHKVAQALLDDSPVTLLKERIMRLDGAVREVEIAVAALPDHGQTAVQMVISDVTDRLRESDDLARSRGDLRRLSANLVEAREEERRRIARELHDELGQRLTALKMELASLNSPTTPEAQHARIGTMLEMVDETVASVRRIATDLRPMMLDDLGLNAAIEWLANGWARRMGIAVRLRLGLDDPPVSEATSIALYRMVQEALTNIARHARATEVRIEMQTRAEQLLLTVQDNGTGFAELSNYPETSHGLMGIRERAYMLGGQLEVGNLATGGARIMIRLPLESPRSGARARAPLDRAAGELPQQR